MDQAKPVFDRSRFIGPLKEMPAHWLTEDEHTTNKEKQPKLSIKAKTKTQTQTKTKTKTAEDVYSSLYLTRPNLVVNRRGKVVSLKRHEAGKKNKWARSLKLAYRQLKELGVDYEGLDRGGVVHDYTRLNYEEMK